MTLKKIVSFAAVSALFVTSFAQVQAGLVTYPDLASLTAAVGGTPNGIVVPNPVNPGGFDFFGNGDASVTYSGITFTQQAALSDGNLFNIGPAFSGVPAVVSSQQQTVGVANILISLPGAVTNIAFDYGTFNGSPVTFTLDNGDSIVLGSTGSNYAVPDFFGITDDLPFTSVQVTSPDFVLNVGPASVVPEPGSLTLLSLGLASIGAFSWMKRRKVEVAA